MTTVSKRLPSGGKTSERNGRSVVKKAISSRPAPYRSRSVGSLADRRVWQKGVRYLKRSDSILARIIDRVGPVKFDFPDNHYAPAVPSILLHHPARSAPRAPPHPLKHLHR